MSSTITTGVVTGGTNSHATTVAEINGFRSDFATAGVVGTITLNAGSGGTGSFAVNAQSSPAMFVDVTAGTAYVTATPSGQVSQLLRVNMTATYTSYAISSNSSGSTKYDWVYLKVDPTAANNPASNASDVTALYTSRSSSATADNGSPPTYGLLLGVVTVANGASSIANSAITDSRANSALQAVSTTTYFFDFVESGCVWSGDSYASTLNASMTSGFVWISGKRLSVATVSARAFTASKDTYVDLSDNGDGTAAFTYTTATNNAASPALAAGAVRIAIIVSGASTIATAGSVNQGQEDKVLPIASSIAYSVTDSLGNLICPRDSQRKVLGYRQLTGDANPSGGDIIGLNLTVIVPAGRKICIKAGARAMSTTSGASTAVNLQLYEGATQIGEAGISTAGANYANPAYAERTLTPSTGSHTYKVSLTGGGGTLVLYANTNYPSWIKVKLL